MFFYLYKNSNLFLKITIRPTQTFSNFILAIFTNLTHENQGSSKNQGISNIPSDYDI